MFLAASFVGEERPPNGRLRGTVGWASDKLFFQQHGEVDRRRRSDLTGAQGENIVHTNGDTGGSRGSPPDVSLARLPLQIVACHLGAPATDKIQLEGEAMDKLCLDANQRRGKGGTSTKTIGDAPWHRLP